MLILGNRSALFINEGVSNVDCHAFTERAGEWNTVKILAVRTIIDRRHVKQNN